jgi:hypothetical protein
MKKFVTPRHNSRDGVTGGSPIYTLFRWDALDEQYPSDVLSGGYTEELG